MNARARSVIAQWVIAALVLALVRGPLALVPTVDAASSFRPTIFVNTEAFLAIDDDDTTADVVLRFGDTLAKTLSFNRSLDRFEFNDDVYVTGTIQASNTVSGAVVYGAKSLRSSGSLVWEGAASGSMLYLGGKLEGAGLTDCDTGATSKLLWDATTGRFSCGTDQGAAYTAGQGLSLNGSNAFSLNAYHTGTTIWAVNALRSSGSLTWEGIGSGAKLFVKDFLSVGSRASGSLLTVGRVGSGTNIATATNATLFSTDQMALGQLEGGAFFGRVGLKENQWGLSNYGTVWTAKDSDRTWTDIAMSSDGKIQTATVYQGQIYVSRDYGNTWTAKGGSDWQSVAMSADGKVQTATVYGGQAYVSFDYGDTWTAKGPTIDWYKNAMSSDGKNQAAVTDGGQIYVSADYGATWVAKDTSRSWVDIAMSSDGKILSAIVSAGQIYISSDYGNTWVAKDSNQNWVDSAMSSDGKIQAATVNGGQIYISRDYGNTWVAKDSLRAWRGIALSSDGKIQAATVISGQIYISTDYGNTWSAKESNREWSPIAMSSDGKVITAAVNQIGGGKIYVSHSTSFQYGSVAIGTGSVKGNTKLMVQGILSGVTLYATKSFSGAGLSDCDTAGTSKLLWDATTGRFSCGTDSGTTYTAGQGLSLNGSNAFSLNTTITGSLVDFTTVSGSVVKAGFGSSTVPSITFAGDSDTGFFQNGANGIGITLGGTNSWVFVGSDGSFYDADGSNGARLKRGNGSPSAPTYSFAGDTNTGIYDEDAGDNLGISTNGVSRMYFTAAGNVSVSNATEAKSKLDVVGILSGVTLYATKSFSGAGLSDCDTGATSKLLWDATTGRFSCGTDQTGGAGGAWSNTGSLQTYFDNRYVNTSGDTMTGVLALQNGTAHTATTTPLLNVRGTMSGKGLNIMGSGASALLSTTADKPTVRIGGSGSLVLEARSTDPGSAPANTASLFAQKVGGRTMLHQGSGSTFAASALQPSLFGNLIISLSTGAGTTVNGYGTTVTNDTTVSHPAPSETFGYMTNFATAATNGDEAGTSSTTASFFRGSAAGANGFFYHARVGVVDTTSITVFSGMADQTIATMVGSDNPTGNHVGFQFSTGRGDTNWMFTTKDNTTQSVNSTGLAFTANKVYDLIFMCTKQCASITWEIRNVTDGTSAMGTTSSNLPAAGTALRIVLGVEAETGTAKNIRMQQIYVEADR